MDTLDQLNQKNHEREIEWSGHQLSEDELFQDMLFRSNELAGETGELCNWIKKLSRTHQDMKGGIDPALATRKIREELADIIICCDRVADVFAIDLSNAVVDKFNATSDKHGFDTKMEYQT